MDDQKPSRGKMMHDAYELAEKQIRKGAPLQQVQSMLVEMGFDEKTAESVVVDIDDMRTKCGVGGQGGTEHMINGALWFIGGLLFTAITYCAAGSGEVYFIALGPIIYGALQFLRGLSAYHEW